MEKFEKKSLLELKRMSLVELNKYMSDKREYEYNNNIPLNYDAIETRKRIHFLVTTILKIDRIIDAHEKITIMNDLRTRKEEGQIYACTHIGGNDVHRLVEAINDSSYIFFGDPGVAYTDPVGFLLYMNGTIYVHTREKLDRKIGYERAVELLNHGGKLIIFPEGAWNIDTNLPVAKTFKGATRMAYETGRDITPVAIEQYGNEFIVNIGENYKVDSNNYNEAEERDKLRDKLATLKWDIWETRDLESRDTIEIVSEHDFAQRIVDLLSDHYGYDLQGVYDTRYQDLDMMEQKQVEEDLRRISVELIEKEYQRVLKRKAS